MQMSNQLKTIKLLKVYVPEVKSSLEYTPTHDSEYWKCECRDLSGSITNHRTIHVSWFMKIYSAFKDNPNTTIEHDTNGRS